MAHAEKHFRNLLDKVAEEQGYHSPQIEVHQLPNVGANFTSFLFVATISESGKDDLELFGKVAAVSEEMRAMAPLKMFEVEGYFYEHLLATYKKLEVEHDVPIEDRLITPAFYGLHPTVGEETIILENLKNKGFTTLDRFEVFTWEYVTTAAKELAKFHALSFALAKEDPEKYAENIKRFKFDWDTLEAMAPIMKSMMEGAVASVSEENRPRFGQFVKTLLESKENMTKYFAANTVLKHGDFRASNLMHKLHEDGTLTVVPLDYQTIQAGEPITDLMYLIFTGTDAAFRKENWQRLLDFYYDQLAAAMRRLDVDPEETYSRERFDQSVKDMLPYGLVVALTVLSLVVTEAPPTVGVDLNLEDFRMDAGKVYAERLNGIISDYIEWGVL